jgi:hypothetical protein
MDFPFLGAGAAPLSGYNTPMLRIARAALFLVAASGVARADTSLPAMPSSSQVDACRARPERARVELGRSDRQFARGKIVRAETVPGNFSFALEAPRETDARPPDFTIELTRQQDAFYDEQEVDHLDARAWPRYDRTDGAHGLPMLAVGRHMYMRPRAIGWTIFLVVYFSDEDVAARFARFRDVFARASEDCVLLLRGQRLR